MITKIYLIILCACFSLTSFSQNYQIDCQVIGSWGGFYENSDENTFTSTAGEVAIFTLEGANTATQGFHQPECAETTVSTKETIDIEKISIYPNPTFGLLNLRINTSNSTQYQVQIINVFGQSLKNINFISSEESALIDCSDFPSGYYFLMLENKSNHRTQTLPFIIVD